MKCKCGSPNCKNEIWIDPEGHILITSNSDNDVSIYLDLETVNILIEKLIETKTTLEGDK